MNTAVVGVNWGDEGKGRMVDLLSEQNDIIIRYQGGANAGHTVINEFGKFALNLLPSGIFRKEKVNILGLGMVIDLEHLSGEINTLRKSGISITPENLKISDKAIISTPYHKLLDELEEDRLAESKQGSTRRGIAPAYSDKALRKALRIEDLFNFESLKSKVAALMEWKNLSIEKVYGHTALKVDQIFDWLVKYGTEILPYVCDVAQYISSNTGKNILFEAQLGALRDLDYGIYPYTTSSCALAAYAPIGAGVPFAPVDSVIGIVKAYSSSVGGGPFTVEMQGAEAEALREAGGEYGAATGRPRRVGAFDVVASVYGVQMQNVSEIALTKLDVLSYMDKIPVCVAYEIDGKITKKFPTGDRLVKAKPVYEYLEGFKTDVSGCRKISDIPAAALEYVRFIENALGKKIKYLSVGAERNAYIQMY
ncbi:MAG: adenylosuccinate synthase [Clostridiales bacterium]|jgi:adenylosuccinate synthase|nr:adenylosuccinate synthase [Clostridiales bacterium]